MNKFFGLSAAATTLLVLSACVSQPTTTTALKNINYEVTGVGKTQLDAKTNAINVAKQKCGADASPVVITEHSNYQGVLNETTGKVLQKANTVVDKIKGSESDKHAADYQTIFVIQCR